MLYYVGKGTEFKKEECQKYKTLKNALIAAAKDEALIVWDENGEAVAGLTDNVLDGALKTNSDGSVVAFDENGYPSGTIDADTVATVIEREAQKGTREDVETVIDGQKEEEIEKCTPEVETGKNEENTEPEENKTIIPKGTMRVTVICDGTLNLRRSANWGNANICGRAARGQSYYVKAIHTVEGKKMIQTIDDIYLSGASEYVRLEQL